MVPTAIARENFLEFLICNARAPVQRIDPFVECSVLLCVVNAVMIGLALDILNAPHQ